MQTQQIKLSTLPKHIKVMNGGIEFLQEAKNQTGLPHVPSLSLIALISAKQEAAARATAIRCSPKNKGNQRPIPIMLVKMRQATPICSLRFPAIPTALLTLIN